jgi:hypothetical protein
MIKGFIALVGGIAFLIVFAVSVYGLLHTFEVF